MPRLTQQHKDEWLKSMGVKDKFYLILDMVPEKNRVLVEGMLLRSLYHAQDSAARVFVRGLKRIEEEQKGLPNYRILFTPKKSERLWPKGDWW